MRLYSGMSRNFIEDTVRNQIAGKLENAFFRHLRYKPSQGEVNSWRNSLRAIAQVFQASDLLDHGVILEYQLPLTSKRLDCLVCGRDGDGSDGAVIVELKQWEKCSPALGERLVTTDAPLLRQALGIHVHRAERVAEKDYRREAGCKCP